MDSTIQRIDDSNLNPTESSIDLDAQAILARRALLVAVAVAGLAGAASCGGNVSGDGASALTGGATTTLPAVGEGVGGGSELNPTSPSAGRPNSDGQVASGGADPAAPGELAMGGALAMGGFVNVGGSVATGGADTGIDPGNIDFGDGTGGETSSGCGCQGAMCQGCT